MIKFESLGFEYFNWLKSIICRHEAIDSPDSYNKLLEKLHNTVFSWSCPMDANRAGDGINVRHIFLFDKNYNDGDIIKIDEAPCSVLEMMIALADRWETSTMSNELYGNRTALWFWKMVQSLGLLPFKDENYSDIYVDYILNRFSMRQYEPNGEGGLFTINDPILDMRYMEIWQQANVYFKEVLKAEGI